MKKAEILKELITQKDYNVRSFAQKCGMPESTLYTILKNGVGKASVDNIILICRNLGITVEELENMTVQNSELEDMTVQTVAAHLDVEDLTEDEREDVENYIEIVKKRRKNKE